GRVDGYVPPDVVGAVVGEEQSFARRVLEAVRCRVGMQGRRTAIRPDDQIGCLAEKIPAAAIAQKCVDDQVEVLHQFQVEVGFAAAALFGETLTGEGIVGLKRAEEASKLDMHQVAVYLRIERNLGLDIGVQVRLGVGAGAEIDLRVGVRSGKQAGQNDRASARGAAAVLVGSLEGEAQSYDIAGVIQGADLGSA